MRSPLAWWRARQKRRQTEKQVQALVDLVRTLRPALGGTDCPPSYSHLYWEARYAIRQAEVEICRLLEAA